MRPFDEGKRYILAKVHQLSDLLAAVNQRLTLVLNSRPETYLKIISISIKIGPGNIHQVI